MMKFSQNESQKWTILFGFFGDVINILFSIFCVFFIPLTNVDVNLSNYKIVFLLLSNFISFSSFILVFVIEIKRELWLIDHFDYSKKYNSIHLSTYKQKYPQIFERLADLNYKYFIIYKFSKWIYYLNFIFTFTLLCLFYFDNYKTIIGLFSSFWFCNTKIMRGIKIAEESFRNNAGYSFYNTLSLSFNRIDSKFKRHNSTSNPESVVNSLNNSVNGAIKEQEETDIIDSLNASFRSMPGILESETTHL